MEEQKDSLLSKLEEFEQRYCEIDGQLSDPAVSSDPARLVALSKEKGKLREVVTKYRRYLAMATELDEAGQILTDAGSDNDLKQLAEEEKGQLEQKLQALLEEIKDSLVMAEEAAIGSIIMEIRAGTGGDEAALFARDLQNMYVRYAEKRGWKVEQLDFSPTERGGFREIIMGVKGPGVWAELGYEGGGHRVQRIPETESQGRIHTSAATVAVMPEPEELDVQINPADVIEHVSRASGPGGQSVNKLNSAIKLEHIPTGITVSMRDEKSQHKNRAKAWRILRTRVYELHESKRRAQRDSQRKIMIGSGDRSERIRTYNFPQNRVTDHRINLSLHSLDKIMMGELDELVAALKEHDKQQRLRNL
ncbi:MAG: peptide chain release factor 1 [Planctomycetota bacterium]